MQLNFINSFNMAGNFWKSSHNQQWIFDREHITSQRKEDLKILSETEYQKVMIFFTNVIQSIGEAVKVPQQVIATAIVYLKRFYTKYSFQSCDPLLLAPTCIYLASKVEEFGPLSNTRLMTMTQNVIKQKFSYAFSEFGYSIKQLWECEFYLMELVDCCLVVYHPYRQLIQYVNDLKISDSSDILAKAWSILNDTYRTDVILMYPPYMIALASLHMACLSHGVEEKVRDWFVDLNVDIDKLVEITVIIYDLQEIWTTFDLKTEVEGLLKKIPKPCLTLDNKPGVNAS